MTMSLFDQFTISKTLGIPLILLAILMPSIMMLPQNHLTHNRLTALQTLLIFSLTKHLFTPLNKPGHKWPLCLLSLMWLLLLLNLAGLLPYTFTPTTQLSLALSLACPLWLTTILIGIRNQPGTTVAHMLPLGTPAPLIPALVLIETISLLIRPVALGVRLTANLTAGHLLITLTSAATLTIIMLLPKIATLAIALLLLLSALEVAVAMIQAYVFVLLLTLYMQENT
uniref:ATP synthase subunit a n=1 Tax=Paroedura masobe TaxID=347812 RepID=A0A7R7J3U5_9SAUR|nr:ATPase subunit 6 [Paroedura masobe]